MPYLTWGRILGANVIAVRSRDNANEYQEGRESEESADG